MADIIELVLAAFAIYRISYLISAEEGPYLGWPHSDRQEGIFLALRKKLSRYVYDEQGSVYIENNLGRGLHCPLCVGAYVTIVVSVLVIFSNTLTSFLLLWWGLWGVQTFLEQLTGD